MRTLRLLLALSLALALAGCAAPAPTTEAFVPDGSGGPKDVGSLSGGAPVDARGDAGPRGAHDGGCTGSGAGDLSGVTDSSPYTSGQAPVADGLAFIEVALPAQRPIHAVTARAKGTTPIALALVTPTGEVPLGTLELASTNTYVRFLAPADAAVAVRVSSDAAFSITELGIQGDPCFEALTVDMGEARQVGWVRTKHYAGGHSLGTTLQASTDGVTWDTLATLDPKATALVDTLLPSPVEARMLRVRHEMEEADWAKAYVFELAAYGAEGPYGPMPEAAPQARTMAELLGVNGIWGWGTSEYSDLLDAQHGPELFAHVASTARNYHNLSWDVKDPDHVPDYDAMAAGAGTEAMWWLDWDREYGAWAEAGLLVQASIQFLASTFPVSAWDDAYGASYAYGYAFARHFGPTLGAGAVGAMEIGNEPWDYPAAFYLQVLAGMAAGAKAGDPAMDVLPCALQADSPEAQGADGGNYIGARLTAEVASHLDALNLHVYSFAHLPDGVRITVQPEHRESAMNGLRNMLRFRDHNMPGAPIHVTEWGWDSDAPGEACTATECVSEAAQAIYGVRAALLFARMGVARLHWYFYADSPSCSTLFCRSGLTGSKNVDFAPKRSFRAFQAMLARVGQDRFQAVLREDDAVRAYVLSSADGAPAHLVAWRPVPAEDTAAVSVTLPVPGSPGAAWSLAGDSPSGEPVVSPTADAGGWTLTVTATPTVVEIK